MPTGQRIAGRRGGTEGTTYAFGGIAGVVKGLEAEVADGRITFRRIGAT